MQPGDLRSKVLPDCCGIWSEHLRAPNESPDTVHAGHCCAGVLVALRSFAADAAICRPLWLQSHEVHLGHLLQLGREQLFSMHEAL